jgi:hypothetical protein
MTDKIEHANIYEALLAAQPAFDVINKDAKAIAGREYKYATLPNVLDAVLPALNSNGIALLQMPVEDGEVQQVKTILHHSKSKTEISCIMSLNKDGHIKGMQAIGSAITYARRYSLMSLLGIAADDDDGKAAVENQSDKKPNQTNKIVDTAKTWFDWIGKVKTSSDLDKQHAAIFDIAKGLEDANELDRATKLKSAFIIKQTELRAKESVVQDGLQGSGVDA